MAPDEVTRLAVMFEPPFQVNRRQDYFLTSASSDCHLEVTTNRPDGVDQIVYKFADSLNKSPNGNATMSSSRSNLRVPG